jgi:diguanylate cyclase (GGDEF)-like protein
MAQTNQTNTQNVDDSKNKTKAVVNISKYQSQEQAASPVNAAFEQVMSQMNIADRHDFDVQYETYWQQASEKGQLLSVLICEIDFFKDYTANYGQQGSSFMLLVIGLALKNTCEKHDCFLARYGSNEFAILVKGRDADEVQEIGEVLRLAVEESRTEHKHSQVSKFVTLSIGISSVYPTSMKLLMQKSENALHSAKTEGCNRVASNIKLKTSPTVTASAVQEQEVVSPPKPVKNQLDTRLTDINVITKCEFKEHYTNIWEDALNDKDSLSMAICELDFFSVYREHEGDKSSDDIVVTVATELQKRCEDFHGTLTYLGEDKFVALIKGGNATLGLKAANTLKDCLADLAIRTYSPVKYCLTMSIGLANVFPSITQSKESLMDNAESALNKAKASGYDQIKRM